MKREQKEGEQGLCRAEAKATSGEQPKQAVDSK